MASKYALIAMALLCASAHGQEAAPSAAVAPDASASPEQTTAPAPSGISTQPRTYSGVATIGDLDRIQSQTLLAEAQRKLADAKRSLDQAQQVGPTAETEAGEAPIVAGVFGPQDRPYARFLISGGGQVTGRAGDLLPGGYRVQYVGVDRVVILDSKRRPVVARFGTSAPSAPGPAPTSAPAPAAPAGAGNNVPPLPVTSY